MPFKIQAVAAICAVLLASPVLAQVAQREQDQENRVIQGERSGELTGREATHLQQQQNRIDRRAAIDRARNGGRLTAGERARLSARENSASTDIYRDKHNMRVR